MKSLRDITIYLLVAFCYRYEVPTRHSYFAVSAVFTDMKSLRDNLLLYRFTYMQFISDVFLCCNLVTYKSRRDLTSVTQLNTAICPVGTKHLPINNKPILVHENSIRLYNLSHTFSMFLYILQQKFAFCDVLLDFRCT